MGDNLTELDLAAESGNYDRFLQLVNEGHLEHSFTDVLDAMDTAYRGTKVSPPQPGCEKIVEYLSILGVPVPTYEFHLLRAVN